jgi:hypothetical protein
MCIVQGDIKRVSNTRIFVGPVVGIKTRDGKLLLRQLTIYANKVVQAPRPSEVRGRWTPSQTAPLASSSSRSDGPTPAMILPAVSFLNGSDVVPVDLTGREDIFDTLDAAFPREMTFGMSRSRNAAFDTLAVIQVGSYDVSIVPTRDDFSRLSREHFVLDPNVADLFAERYPKDFAFVVCRLRPGEKFHPIAYVSAMSSDMSLFVPAYHYHGQLEFEPDWDHTIYCAGGPRALLRNDSLKALPANTQTASSENGKLALEKLQSKLPVPLDFGATNTLTKMEIKRFNENCDLIYL